MELTALQNSHQEEIEKLKSKITQEIEILSQKNQETLQERLHQQKEMADLEIDKIQKEFSKSLQELSTKNNELIAQIESLKIQMSNKDAEIDAVIKEKQILEESQAKLKNQVNELDKELQLYKPKKGAILPEESYDIIIQTSLLSTLIQGWDIKISRLEKYKKLIEEKGIIVSVLGNKKVGKTKFLEMLTGQSTSHGYCNSSPGLYFKYYKDEKYPSKAPLLSIELQGYDIPILSSQYTEESLCNFHRLLDDQEASLSLCQDYLFEVSSMFIVIAKDFTARDQALIHTLKLRLKDKIDKRLVIVHNLSDSYTIKDAKLRLETQILPYLHVKENSYTRPSSKNMTFYSDGAFSIRHLILAHECSEAGVQ